MEFFGGARRAVRTAGTLRAPAPHPPNRRPSDERSALSVSDECPACELGELWTWLALPAAPVADGPWPACGSKSEFIFTNIAPGAVMLHSSLSTIDEKTLMQWRNFRRPQF